MSKKKNSTIKNSGIKNLKTKILKLEDLNWTQIDELPRDKTVFFLPISPLEEHGPHLPVGTDLFTSRDTATKAIEMLQREKPDFIYVLLPSLPIGNCPYVTDFPGSISVSSRVIKEIVYKTAESLGNFGFKYMTICTYHMAVGHLKGIYGAMKKIRSKLGMYVTEPWGPYFHSGMIQKNEPKLGFDTTKERHAGFRETSLMKYQYPYLVADSHKNLQSIYRDLQSPKIIGKTFKQIGLKDGYVGSPARADADYGRWFFTETVKVYYNGTIDMLNGKKPPELPRKLRTAMKVLFWQ